jgi:anti-sigma B factor antagonist
VTLSNEEGMDEASVQEPLIVRSSPVTEGRMTLELVGELDVFSAPDLTAAIQQAIGSGGRTVELDLRGVAFVDSSGLASIIDAHRTLATVGGSLVLGRRSSVAERLFAVSGIESVLISVDPDGR